MTDPLALLFATVIGLMIGSFLNVCIYRIPKQQSLMFPGSRCGSCGKPLRWFDNIPVVSYLALRGRCGQCGAAISIRDRKSTRLNSSHGYISYAVFCLKKK